MERPVRPRDWLRRVLSEISKHTRIGAVDRKQTASPCASMNCHEQHVALHVQCPRFSVSMRMHPQHAFDANRAPMTLSAVRMQDDRVPRLCTSPSPVLPWQTRTLAHGFWIDQETFSASLHSCLLSPSGSYSALFVSERACDQANSTRC